MTKLQRLAVVIPTLNEEAVLPATLASLAAQTEPANEIVVADGGSTDGTAALAEKHGARVLVSTKKGRGCQIAATLKQIDEEVVLIVHADMIVPTNALEMIRARLAEDVRCPGGCLGHRFDNPHRIYRWIEWWDRRRALRGMSYGDQGQFFRRDLLEGSDGFPELPIMEDVELSRRLCRLGSPAYLDCPVVVSSRRFDRLGWRRVALHNLLFRFAFRCAGPRRCEAIYRRYYSNDEDPNLIEAARSASDGAR